MHIWTKRGIVGSLIVLNLALGAQAQEPPKVQSLSDMNKATSTQWTLSTDDTHLRISVANNRIYMDTLKNPAQNWNWTPVASEVPLIKNVVIQGTNSSPNWIYRNAKVENSTGTTVTLMFTSTAPNLELKSIWRARPGVGPVENQTTVGNNTADAISFNDADLVAANLSLVSDGQVHLFPVAGGSLGYGEGLPLPYQMIQVGTTHGVYLAYDYGCGQFASTIMSNQIASRWWAAGIKNTTTRTGETFRCPGMLIEAYQGDEDDGANNFRRWFWRYEITRSLHDNPDDPPICLGEWPYYDGKPDVMIERIKSQNYAGWGVGLWKTDAWHMKTRHAKSAELAATCHSNKLQLCLYWNNPRTEEEIAAEWNKSRFDYYRMDQWIGPPPFNLNDYHSFMNFNRKIDALSKKYGIKLENCCNGGNIRSLDVFRRMTWMTHSDNSSPVLFFRHISAWSYMMCPMQIRNDYPIDSTYNGQSVGDGAADLQGLLLGSILLAATRIPHGGNWEKDIPTEFTPTTLDKIKAVFSLYNTKQRAILRGADVYHILPTPAHKAKGQWFGLQYYNTFIDKGSVLLWQNGGPASQVIKLKGLDRNATYTLAFEDATGKNGTQTGAQLMDDGVDVPMGPNASEIVWIDGPNGQTGVKPATGKPNK